MHCEALLEIPTPEGLLFTAFPSKHVSFVLHSGRAFRCAVSVTFHRVSTVCQVKLLCMQGLRGSIPANFPYFHVEFNLTKGFVHVIDDETKFDPHFGRSIMIGLLDLPAEDMHR